MMGQDDSINVLIVGAGKGGSALLDIFRDEPLISIVGIVDRDDGAPGMALARSLDVPTGTRIHEFISDDLDQIIDVTGSPEVHMMLVEGCPPGVEIVSGKTARMLWLLIDERERAEARINDVLDALEKSNRDLQEFAYVASHDLQEPLRMVSSYVSLLERRYRDQLDEDANDFIGFAVDGARRMQVLIDDLLQFSRVETRGRPFEPLSLNDVFDAVVTDLKVAIEEAGADVTRNGLPDISGDPSQVRRLMQNLVSNAIKFRGEDAPRIHIGAEQKGDNWCISVRDNGIGIDPEFRERIFVIFQRLHGREEYEGTGIGLAVSKRIVERHGGEIWVESEPGEGATFYFTVPITRSETT